MLEVRPRNYRLLMFWMTFSQLMALASLYPLLLMAGTLFTLMTGTPPADIWSFLLAASPFPAIPLLLSVAAWFALRRRQYRSAALLAGRSLLLRAGGGLLVPARVEQLELRFRDGAAEASGSRTLRGVGHCRRSAGGDAGAGIVADLHPQGDRGRGGAGGMRAVDAQAAGRFRHQPDHQYSQLFLTWRSRSIRPGCWPCS